MSQRFRKKLPEVERKKIVDLAQPTLYSGAGQDALQYLTNERKLAQDVLRVFSVGYVPQSVRNLWGYNHEFSGRIIFPIFDQYNDLVALSSRDWRENAYMKFFHEQFDKSNYLYGLNVAKKSILKFNKAIVVEGDIDVLMSHQVNLRLTVGVLGSAINLKQIALLSRYCQNILFVFDGDKAGREALKRVIKLNNDYRLYRYDINIIGVQLPNGYDPDLFIVKEGKDKYVNFLSDASKKFLEERIK
ncbi:MAG: toprim domain-containing protein [Elusimicrobiota bacterium]